MDSIFLPASNSFIVRATKKLRKQGGKKAVNEEDVEDDDDYDEDDDDPDQDNGKDDFDKASSQDPYFKSYERWTRR